MPPKAFSTSSRKKAVKSAKAAGPPAWPIEDIPACWRRPDWQAGFRRRLLAWFSRNKRDLPWRRTKDPYAVWLSEIMLQQTQTPTVIRYFERFLAAFPTVQALAQAQQAEVLRLWEGLGYYRRAVQLHQAAQKIVSDFGGQFPQTPEQLLQLPGIGRYTAGAILSIAFDKRAPILEANTVRLWARLLAYEGPTGSAKAQRLFWQMAELVLPRRQVGRFNQALMELGSTVCLPRQPQCAYCPVSRFCLAFQKGLQQALPRQRPKPAVEFYQEAALIVRQNDRVLLRRIPEGQRWAGLWEFPRFTLPPELAEQLAKANAPGPPQGWLFPPALEEPEGNLETGADPPSQLRSDSASRPQSAQVSQRSRKTGCGLVLASSGLPPAMAKFLVEQMRQEVGIEVRPIRALKTIRYAVTRYRVWLHCYEAEYLGWGTKPLLGDSKGLALTADQAPGNPPGQEAEAGGFQWVALRALDQYPMSSPGRKLARLAQRVSSNARRKEIR